MDLEQEDALYKFLENSTEPFSLDEISAFVLTTSPKGEVSRVLSAGNKRSKKLAKEIDAYLDAKKIAFKKDNHHWVSRRACFETASFTITPSRQELLNGILIPGHRCVPFANPLTLPHRYKFYWKGKLGKSNILIPMTTTEAPPEELYPYYNLYGEEFAPQYIARDNAKNEEAFNADPYEDPPEVSIHSLDMRSIYRESAFVPGDHFVVRILNWKECSFEITKAGKDSWSFAEMEKWIECAEAGFDESFNKLGPGSSMEEQFAFAYWFGGKRMREVPSYSLEEYVFDKTNRIDIVSYGIETRCWFAGKEIPDSKKLQCFSLPPDRTLIEDILFNKNIPVSEFVILSFIKDAFFRKEKSPDQIINRLIPAIIHIDDAEWDLLTEFIYDSMNDFIQNYSMFKDRNAGPLRQRVIELHNAIIELSAKLQKGEIETTWLPRHTFIVLSQIQNHAAALLEDLAFDDAPPEMEIIAMENSLDSMVDTYTDIKELINTAMDNFRRSNLTIIHGGKTSDRLWQMIQISITGIDVWRRAIIPHDLNMKELHQFICIGMDWSGDLRFRFYCETSDGGKEYLHDNIQLGDIDFQGKKEIIYEYAKWTVKIIVMSSYQGEENDKPRYVTGEGNSPSENLEGPRHYKRLHDKNPQGFFYGGITSIETSQHELGSNFNQTEFAAGVFDLEKINNKLSTLF
ncbi:MAG: plasmid pRiA4b ORF-3 family protein [Treponema sp.]|nr:plasmid pRiA4b ORF-3 family protein [Treponema sp.]MCL2252539.1 plasmid pRiA4b ORF-3 family protein [Treponema sp.]